MISSKKMIAEQRMVVILGIVLVLSIIYTMKRMGGGGASSALTTTTALNINDVRDNLSKIVKFKIEEKAGSRDPLIRPPEIATAEAQISGARSNLTPGSAEESGGKPSLQGIIWGGKEKFAIISGKVVSEGEIADGAKVLSISEDGVILEKNNSRIELKR